MYSTAGREWQQAFADTLYFQWEWQDGEPPEWSVLSAVGFMESTLKLATGAKVLDMGLARMEREATEGQEAARITRDGVVMGTLDYLAPEQALDSHSADTRADIYSLGCTLYKMLAGQAPLGGS